MLKTTIKALVCAGVTFTASAVSANDMNSNEINASELTNIQFLRAGANGFRLDNRDRRDEVKGIIEDRIDMARERRVEIKALIASGTLGRESRMDLWAEYSSLKTRLQRLYRDRRGVNQWGVMDLAELEEFYAPAVSVS